MGDMKFPSFGAAKFLLNFQVRFALYGQENYVLKDNLCFYKCFTDVLNIFFGAKEKLQNAPDLRWIYVEFCDVLSRLYLPERIHDPDSVTRIALKDHLFGF